MSNVEWAGRRLDVLAALEVLSVLTPTAVDVWPSLTDAIHWLVDDTWCDARSPADDIGLLLASQEEADAVSAVLGPLLIILDELGPVRDDTDYVRHRLWSDVRLAATNAMGVLTRTRWHVEDA